MRQLLAAGAAVALMSTASMAADLPTPVESYVPASVYDWSGFYAGLHVGYGTGEAHFVVTPPGEYQDMDGFFGGGQIGYNIQNGNWVYGIQSELSWSDVSSDEAGTGSDDTIDWMGATSLRIGYAFDTVLLYAKAGVAYGEGTGHLGNPPAEAEDSNVHIGWTVGAGAEFALGENWSAFVEYAYLDFSGEDYDFTPVFGLPVEAEFEFHTVKAGVNFRF